jgi:hypothetical protein
MFPFQADFHLTPTLPIKIFQVRNSCIYMFMIHIKSNMGLVSYVHILHCYFFIAFSSSPLKYFVCILSLVTLNSFAFQTGMFLLI